MKVTQSKGNFKPVTIVLETENELECLWHIMNTPTGSLVNYLRDEDIPNDEVLTFGEALFDKLDKIREGL